MGVVRQDRSSISRMLPRNEALTARVCIFLGAQPWPWSRSRCDALGVASRPRRSAPWPKSALEEGPLVQIQGLESALCRDPLGPHATCVHAALLNMCWVHPPGLVWRWRKFLSKGFPRAGFPFSSRPTYKVEGQNLSRVKGHTF